MTSQESREKKISRESVEARLERLLREAKRPQASLLEENLVSIEQALARGVSRVAVWKALQEEGFTLTFGSFENALHRIRKKKAGAPGGVKSKVSGEASKPPAPNEAKSAARVMPQSETKPTPPAGQVQEESLTEQEERELREYKEFEKTVIHLPVVQRARKLADFLEKQSENRMSLSTRRWLERGEKKK